MLGRNIYFTDGSIRECETGAEVYFAYRNLEYSYPLGKYTSIFQAKVYSILQCATYINLRLQENERISIYTDGQAALRVTSKLVWSRNLKNHRKNLVSVLDTHILALNQLWRYQIHWHRHTSVTGLICEALNHR